MPKRTEGKRLTKEIRIRKWLARRLDPEVQRTEDRLDKILSALSYERHWFSPEFPDVRETMERILESDRAYNRRLDEPAVIPTVPTDVSGFREHLRRRTALKTGTSE